MIKLSVEVVKLKIFEELQRISKSLLLPVAVLPAAAIMFRFGSADLFNVEVIAKAGQIIFTELPVIFAISIAFGLAKDEKNNGAAALAGFVSYSVLNAAITSINPEIDMGVLLGIISGLMTGFLYNRYYKVELPDFLGFFGGRRFIPIISSISAIILAFNFLGEILINSGGLGTFIFGFLNRMLIPTGLHHILGSLINFVFGEYVNPMTGEVIHGDLNRFFAGDPTAGIFMTGFYPIMMFGLPAITLAMYHTAKIENRKKIVGALISMAFTSFLTGITEPIEFSFMFSRDIMRNVNVSLL